MDWWLSSGLQLIYDQDALIGATRHNRPEVLLSLSMLCSASEVYSRFWNGGTSLTFLYSTGYAILRKVRTFFHLRLGGRHTNPIPALEDAIGGGDAAREWWRGKGVDFNANDKEWMKLQNLN